MSNCSMTKEEEAIWTLAKSGGLPIDKVRFIFELGLEMAAEECERWPNRGDTMERAEAWSNAGGWGNAVAATAYDLAARIRAKKVGKT